jgi:hypothetical protein
MALRGCCWPNHGLLSADNWLLPTAVHEAHILARVQHYVAEAREFSVLFGVTFQ